MQKKYIAGGIIIETDIEFPELILTEGETDVVLAYGKVPEQLSNVKNEKALFSSNENEVLFRMPDIARYLIEGHSKITIEPIDEKRKADAEKYILTFILGVLSFKKGFYPLHGGGVIHNGEAYLFTGHSGAGKSTTMAGLQQRGFQPVGDDIANLFVKDGKVYVHPCFPRFKLWKDSLNFLNKKGSGEYHLRSDMEKFLVPMGDDFSIEPVLVKRIYLLVEDRNFEYSFKEIKGKEKLQRLKVNSYKPWMVKAFSLNQLHFGLMNDIVVKVEITEYHRPLDKANLDKMYDLLIENIKA
ncbi:MAG: hypothetical protein ACO3EE_03675 [Flavobacteriales bacterium]